MIDLKEFEELLFNIATAKHDITVLEEEKKKLEAKILLETPPAGKNAEIRKLQTIRILNANNDYNELHTMLAKETDEYNRLLAKKESLLMEQRIWEWSIRSDMAKILAHTGETYPSTDNIAQAIADTALFESNSKDIPF